MICSLLNAHIRCWLFSNFTARSLTIVERPSRRIRAFSFPTFTSSSISTRVQTMSYEIATRSNIHIEDDISHRCKDLNRCLKGSSRFRGLAFKYVLSLEARCQYNNQVYTARDL
jgi:hypothetical protein